MCQEKSFLSHLRETLLTVCCISCQQLFYLFLFLGQCVWMQETKPDKQWLEVTEEKIKTFSLDQRNLEMTDSFLNPSSSLTIILRLWLGCLRVTLQESVQARQKGGNREKIASSLAGFFFDQTRTPFSETCRLCLGNTQIA